MQSLAAFSYFVINMLRQNVEVKKKKHHEDESHIWATFKAPHLYRLGYSTKHNELPVSKGKEKESKPGSISCY
jgi:hypothetical protein